MRRAVVRREQFVLRRAADGADQESGEVAASIDRLTGRMRAAHRLANPQWTPLAERAPGWMRLGFELFDALAQYEPLEVFPTAS